MIKDDIIRMAREAGCDIAWADSLERFAALVAAAERAECVKSASILAHALVLAERENCAKVCDEMHRNPSAEPDECAAAIRARGQK
jgi:hypothetical protein